MCNLGLFTSLYLIYAIVIPHISVELDLSLVLCRGLDWAPSKLTAYNYVYNSTCLTLYLIQLHSKVKAVMTYYKVLVFDLSARYVNSSQASISNNIEPSLEHTCISMFSCGWFQQLLFVAVANTNGKCTKPCMVWS